MSRKMSRKEYATRAKTPASVSAEKKEVVPQGAPLGAFNIRG